MTEATQEAEATNDHPHRRLLVVPKVVCKNCIHHETKVSGKWLCKMGEQQSSPVTGKSWYVTLCIEKNADGECEDYDVIDFEAIAKKKADKEKADMWWSLLGMALALAFIGLMFSQRFGL